MKSFLMLGIVAVYLAGCGNGKNTPDKPLPGPGAAPVAFTGLWASQCYHKGSFMKDFLVVDQHVLTLQRDTFSDDHCTQITAMAQYKMNLAPDRPSTQVKNAREIDMAVSSVQLTAPNDAWASVWNQQKMCGFQNWRALQSREVSGKSCAGNTMPQSQDHRYSIYRLNQDQTMSLGSLAASPGTRPHEIDSTIVYRKIILR